VCGVCETSAVLFKSVLGHSYHTQWVGSAEFELQSCPLPSQSEEKKLDVLTAKWTAAAQEVRPPQSIRFIGPALRRMGQRPEARITSQ
jgi:hypothetical protein